MMKRRKMKKKGWKQEKKIRNEKIELVVRLNSYKRWGDMYQDKSHEIDLNLLKEIRDWIKLEF